MESIYTHKKLIEPSQSSTNGSWGVLGRVERVDHRSSADADTRNESTQPPLILRFQNLFVSKLTSRSTWQPSSPWKQPAIWFQ